MKQILIILFSLILVSCSIEYKIKRAKRMTSRDFKKYFKNIKRGKIQLEYADSTLYQVNPN